VPRPGRLALLLYSVAAGVLLLDRVTKILAERHLAGRPPLVLIPHVLDLSYTTNTGGAFGIFGGQAWVFFAASVAVVAVILALSARVGHLSSAIGLGLILGGAVGNVTDRLIHGSGISGMVTDFIHLHNWPVFNAADSAIVLGAATIAIAGFRRERREAPSPPVRPGPRA